jgi:hypothetical protein
MIGHQDQVKAGCGLAHGDEAFHLPGLFLVFIEPKAGVYAGGDICGLLQGI